MNAHVSLPNNGSPLSVVAIDDDGVFLEFLREALADINVLLYGAMTGREGMDIVGCRSPHLVLVDQYLPDIRGLDLISRVLAARPKPEVVVMTADLSTDLAVEAMKRGASDYLTKPVSLSSLYDKVMPIVERGKSLLRANTAHEESVYSLEGMLSQSPTMEELFSRVRRVGRRFHNALIQGETGTGKELVARALHNIGLGDKRPFVAFNCAAIPDSLVESELFGYVKGAFTGATADHEGLFHAANGGAIFLDEIGDMPMQQQASLLRVLQTRQVRRVGSSKQEPIDVRLIAATHCNLLEMVKNGEFREDLYYRLSSVEIFLPPLRERMEDLPLLANHFLTRISREYGRPIEGLTKQAMDILTGYDWPGNIRELENAIEAACIICEGKQIDEEHIPERVRKSLDTRFATAPTESESLKDLQRHHVIRTLNEVDGNKQKAAKILGVSRTTLYRMLASGNASES